MLRPLFSQSDYPNLTTHLFILLFGSLFLGACSSLSTVKSDDLDVPLIKLHQATAYTLQGNVLRKSANNRTYFSKYHAIGTDTNVGYGKKKERGQVVISLFGDGRPYTIAILYRIEGLDGGEFSLDRYDKDIAKKYLERINQYLASRPEDRDVIDDFRPY